MVLGKLEHSSDRLRNNQLVRDLTQKSMRRKNPLRARDGQTNLLLGNDDGAILSADTNARDVVRVDRFERILCENGPRVNMQTSVSSMYAGQRGKEMELK